LDRGDLRRRQWCFSVNYNPSDQTLLYYNYSRIPHTWAFHALRDASLFRLVAGLYQHCLPAPHPPPHLACLACLHDACHHFLHYSGCRLPGLDNFCMLATGHSMQAASATPFAGLFMDSSLGSCSWRVQPFPGAAAAFCAAGGAPTCHHRLVTCCLWDQCITVVTTCVSVILQPIIPHTTTHTYL